MTNTIAYRTRFNYGTGVDSSSEQLRGVAVIPTQPNNLFGATGAEVTYSIRVVESQRHLEESLGVSAAMSLSYGFSVGGNAKVDFAQENAMTETSVCAVVKVEVKNPVLLMSDVKLQDNAKDLYARDPESFKARYGDSFVNGLLTGGELLGLIMMTTSSMEEKNSISQSLRASGMVGLWSGSLDESVKSQAKEATKNMDTRVFVHTSGYVPDRYPSTVDGLLNLASEFAFKVRQGQGAPYAMDLIEYKYLDLPDGPNLYDLQNRDEVIKYAASKKAEAISKRATIRFIRDHIDWYPTANDQELAQYEAQINSVLDAIQHKISSCYNDYRQCSYGANDLVLPLIELPERINSEGLKLVANPHSFPNNIEWILFDVPDNFQATVKLKVDWGGAVAAGFGRPGMYMAARVAGIGLLKNDGKGLSGNVIRIEASGVQIGYVGGDLYVDSMFDSSGTPYFDGTVYMRITVNNRIMDSTQFSSDGQTFTNSPRIRRLGHSGRDRQLGPECKLALFAWSRDDTPVKVEFSTPTIVPITT